MRKTPFFSRFVEQQSPKAQPAQGIQTDLRAGKPPVTLKYPSDSDEYAQTMKYPSDSDEGGVAL